MAEVRNTFIGSRMNKDLEQRLVPNNEYRDAYNIMISRSEGEDVGSLENVLGNIEVTDFGITDCEVEAIGVYFDVITNRVYVMLTNYVDSSESKLDNQSVGGFHAICYTDLNSNVSDILIQGEFLNFSKTHPVFGINLVDNFLFWTDNRNQPRKINIVNAIDKSFTSGDPYYKNESQISVAKIFPDKAVSLQVRDIVGLGGICEIGTQDYTTTPADEVYATVAMTNLPGIGWVETNGFGMKVKITANVGGNITALEISDRGYGYGEYFDERVYICAADGAFDVDNGAYLQTIDGDNCCSFRWNPAMKDVTSELLPDKTTANPFYDPNYKGDIQYLENKFIRFGYRFKFDDNEYSLISPYTPEAFIPKQDGYFIGDDEERTFKSTEVEFMENKVTQIELQFRAPDRLKWREAIKKYNISSIEIIMKDSVQTSLSSMYTIEAAELENHPSALIQYKYKGNKPTKTLPQKDLLRVYDQVPVRALCQEFADGAVVYGNFLDKHTPPEGIDFNIDANIKENRLGNDNAPGVGGGSTLVVTAPLNEGLRKTAPNHTLKQNRNYKVGIVLSDKFGRQSSVLNTQPLPNSLEATKNTNTQNTIYHPFKDGLNPGPVTGGDADATNTFNWWGTGLGPADPDCTDQNLWGPPTSPGGTNFNPQNTWPGDVLGVQLNETINSQRNGIDGSPGLYSEGGQLLAVNILNTVGNNWFDGDYTINIINGVISPILPGVLMSYGNNITAAEEYCYGKLTIVTDSSTAPGEGNITQVIITPSNTNKLEGVYNVNDIITFWSGGAPGLGDESTFEVTLVTESNPLGWYTYKFVVQQQEQEYYNAYIPGILNGYIDGAYFPENTIISLDTALTPVERYYEGYLNVATPKEPVIHFALHGDNINKIPRDLSLLGPTDTLFRTGRPSVEKDPSYYQFRNTDGELFTIDPYEPESEALLKDRDRQRGIDSGSVLTNSSIKFWPRVTNSSFVADTDQPGASENSIPGSLFPVTKCAFSNTQYYTPIQPSEVTTIGTGQELGLWNPASFYPYNTAKVFYNYQQNPLVAKADVIVKEDENICSLGAIGPYWTDGVFKMGIMSAFYPSGSASSFAYLAGSKNIPYQDIALQDDCIGGTFKAINIHGWVVNINGVLLSTGDTSYKTGDEGVIVLETTIAAVPQADTRTLTIGNKGFTEGVTGLELIPDNRYVYGDPANNVDANRLNFRATIGSGDNMAVTYNQVYKQFSAGAMTPTLAILELEPIRSLLPIYWETSTSGFIKDINDQYEEDNETKFEVNYFNSLWLKKCPKYEAILNLHTNEQLAPMYPPTPPVKLAGACGWDAPDLKDYYMGKFVGVWPGIAPDLGYDSCTLSAFQEGVPKIIQTNVDLLTTIDCFTGFCDINSSYPDFMFPFTPGSCGGAVPPISDVEAFPGSCGETIGGFAAGGWYIEESRVRGGFNNSGMSLGVKAYVIDDNPKGQYRTYSVIHSGVINNRTGYNESNVFSISSPIVKDMDPLHGSLQRFYTEDTNLFTFQESKVNRILINKNALYSGDQGSQDTSKISFLGQTYAYAGEYGISQDPGSFSLFGYRKYFIDRDRSVACRLSGDGITEISGYGMRDWFRDQLSAMTLDWKLCSSSASLILETDPLTYSIKVDTAYSCSYIGALLEVGGVVNELAIVTNMEIDLVSNTTVITFSTNVLPLAGNSIRLVLFKKDSIVSGWDIHNSNYTICIERPKSGDDTINSDDVNYNYYTTCFDETVQGWISFYDFRPIKIDSLKNYFYSLKDGKLWRHYDDSVGNNYGKFYGATVPAPTFINFIFNPNPNVTKNFKTISYEGSNGWETFGGSDLQEVYRTDPQNFTPPFTYGTDYLDTYSTVPSLDEGVYIDPTSGYPENSGFVIKENRYVADLLSENGSEDLRPGQVLFGESIGYPAITPFGVLTGVKGYVLNVTFIVDDTTDIGGRKELFSTASDFVVSSF